MSEYETYGVEREGSVEKAEDEWYVKVFHYAGDSERSVVLVAKTWARVMQVKQAVFNGWHFDGEDSKGHKHYFKAGLITYVEAWSKTQADREQERYEREWAERRSRYEFY